MNIVGVLDLRTPKLNGRSVHYVARRSHRDNIILAKPSGERWKPEEKVEVKTHLAMGGAPTGKVIWA